MATRRSLIHPDFLRWDARCSGNVLWCLGRNFSSSVGQAPWGETKKIESEIFFFGAKVLSCETVKVLDEGGMVDSMKWAVFWFLFLQIFSTSHLWLFLGLSRSMLLNPQDINLNYTFTFRSKRSAKLLWFCSCTFWNDHDMDRHGECIAECPEGSGGLWFVLSDSPDDAMKSFFAEG